MLLERIERILNAHLHESAVAQQLVDELEGRCVTLVLRGLPGPIHLQAEAGAIHVGREVEVDPDAIIEASLSGLLVAATSEARDAVAQGSLRIRGDAVVAQRFSKLLQAVAPELEDALSRVIGDEGATHLGRALRGVGRWSRRVSMTLARDLVEYLQEERRDLVHRYEVEDYLERVDLLRDDADRLEARVRKLARRSSRGAAG